MSRLENMIRENRDGFDSYEPGTGVWNKIQQNLESKTPAKIRRFTWLKWAAAAAFIIAVTTWYQHEQTKPVITIQPAVTVEKNVPDEYAEEVFHFMQLVSLKHKELQKLQKVEPELYEQFSDDIKKLDSSYNSLQQQVPGNPNKETLIQAMIQNLQLQIDLLNKQLSIIEQIKQQKSKNHEQVSKSI